MTPRTRNAIAAAAFAILASQANAQAQPEIAIPLSDPSRPALLEVFAGVGVTVRGYDGDQILVVPLEGSEDNGLSEVNADGLRRIPNTSMGLTAEENDNTVSIRMRLGIDDGGLIISVPRQTSVRVRTIDDGDIVVEGVSGEHELAATDGNITATDVSGSIVANTTDGDMLMSLLDPAPDSTMSFTSFDGNLEVRFPPSLAADLRISTVDGEVLTDFDFQLQPQVPTVERSERGRGVEVRLEQEIRATVGGGGPEIRLQTFDGDIVIRQR